MGKKKQERGNVVDSRRWCNGFTCRYYLCPRHPNNIPARYRNSVFRYVDPSNFPRCERWEAVAARQKEKRKEKENENI